MKVDISFLKTNYAAFNETYFAAALPEVILRLSNAKGYLGQFRVYRKRNWFGILKTVKYQISLSVRYDLPQEVWEDVLLHEMIHFYISYTGKKDSSPHGQLFREMMNRFNEQYGRHIRISYKIR